MPDWVITRRRQIGDRVRAVRTQRRLTQEKLAELTGLDRKTINRIEQGTYGTNTDYLLLVAAALDTPLSELVG